ncbi:hypothetical protein CAEBREN_13869 [Caenorhabditis brenneri]|uniref:non-specific serine/threonine protein kinase n=1 Tax=Caenorhabditis brenneri TaxID=135651 RepID=G0NNR0_CAEBE|nr:hypothetical protein CAEBREN_13869 [Caenorhabditis brenneri]
MSTGRQKYTKNSVPAFVKAQFVFYRTTLCSSIIMSFTHLTNLAGKKFGKIILEKQIGKGNFGVIYEGHFDLEKVACKISDNHDYIKKESDILQELSGSDGVCGWVAMENHSIVSIIAMQCGYGDLDHLRFKNESKSFTNGTIQKISRQILDGLSHIHGKGFTHRDIKLNNMMISQPVGPDQKVHVFLIDFGISCRVVDKNGNRMPRDTRYNFAKLDHATPYTALGDAPDFIDDLIQMTYSMIRATNDPMTEFKKSQYSRMKHKSDLLHRPSTVLSVSLSWMTPLFEAIGSQKPLSPIDYQLIRGSIDDMIPENDARGDLNLQIVGKEFKLI